MSWEHNPEEPNMHLNVGMSWDRGSTKGIANSAPRLWEISSEENNLSSVMGMKYNFLDANLKVKCILGLRKENAHLRGGMGRDGYMGGWDSKGSLGQNYKEQNDFLGHLD